MNLLERRKAALGPAYHLFYDAPAHLVRGQGVWLWDAQGRKYLDCYNNVASVGHCHADVVAALTQQASTLNTHTRYLHENVVELSETIAAKMPGELSVCMFVCTGTEANDLATRIARTVTGNRGMLVSEYSYHGNSTLVYALSTADSDDRPDWLAMFEPPCRYRPAFKGDDLLDDYEESVRTAIDELSRRGQRPAAIMIDSIFDCPGTVEAPAGYFKQVYEAVRASGGLVKDRLSKTPDAEAARCMANMMKDEGVLLSKHGRYDNTLKIRPPMVFSRDNAEQLLAALDVCFGKL